VNRQAQAVVLLLLGGAVTKASVTDVYLRYVKEGLQPFLIAAGVLLVVAAAMTLIQELRQNVDADARDHGDDPDHGPGQGRGDGPDHIDGNGHREPRVGWLLILPVLGLLLVAPPALGADAAKESGTALPDKQVPAYLPLPDGDPAKITVLDYASRAIFDGGTSLGDRRVQLTGFIAPGRDGEPLLVRMILTCCAADGMPIKVGMAGKPPTGLPADTWVEVVGTYTARTGVDPVNGAPVPYLDVATWRQVDPPKQPYE
jgi:uncharacterized repeat protein (TIGR03943 family)